MPFRKKTWLKAESAAVNTAAALDQIALDHSFSSTALNALEQKTAPAPMDEAHTPEWHQAQIANCVERLTSPYLSREGRELWQSYLQLHKQKLRELA